MAKTVQVRDVPDDVHEVLRVRAARAGISLSEYLRREVSLLARRPSMDEFFAQVSSHSHVDISSDEIVAAIHAGRG